MIMIGINGNSGSGKSTFSELLFKNESGVRVIHVDHIFDNIKSILYKKAVDTHKRDNGEEMKSLNKEGLLYKFLTLKYIKEFYDKLRKQYVRCAIKKEIEKAKNDGINYFIIEAYHLYDFFELSEMDIKIFISASPSIRKNRVIRREMSDKFLLEENFLIDDDSEIFSGKYDFIVENMWSLEELATEAEAITNTIKQCCPIIRTREKNNN